MELTTARLSLAPVDPTRDAEGLHAAFSDPDVMRWWNTPLRADVADTHKNLVSSLEGRRAVAVGADIAAPPVEQPWGMREFVLRLSDGHQLVVTGPA